MIAARASLLALLVCWAFVALADVAVPPLSGRVVDQTGTLSASDISALTARLKDLEKRKGSQLAVLIVPTTAPETIEQYSIRVAEVWKIGRKKIDDGVLLVVAKNDHKVRIEVGYGLEGALTDVAAKRIIDESIVPKFRSGDFAGGISLGVEWIIAVIDGEKLPAPVSQPQNRTLQGKGTASPAHLDLDNNIFAVIVVLFVAATLRTLLGRLVGSVAAFGAVTTLVWYFVGSLETSMVAGALAFLFTYADGMTWFWGNDLWSSRPNDSGDFSGEGGSFGGGGATGRW